MISLNRVIVAGNLTRDPELKMTASNHRYTTMTIAINDIWKNKDGEMSQKTNFINIIAWGNLAENCAKYLKKGRSIMVEGKIEADRYEDKNGNMQTITRINASSVVFLENTNKNSDKSSNNNSSKSKNKTSEQEIPAIF